jgi:hypothetical protein
MRALCEIFIIGALIYLGWDIPFGQRIDQIRGKPAPAAVAASAARIVSPAGRTAQPHQPFNTNTALAPAPRPAATPPGSWMWDSNHHSALDPPQKTASPH